MVLRKNATHSEYMGRHPKPAGSAGEKSTYKWWGGGRPAILLGNVSSSRLAELSVRAATKMFMNRSLCAWGVYIQTYLTYSYSLTFI